MLSSILFLKILEYSSLFANLKSILFNKSSKFGTEYLEDHYKYHSIFSAILILHKMINLTNFLFNLTHFCRNPLGYTSAINSTRLCSTICCVMQIEL